MGIEKCCHVPANRELEIDRFDLLSFANLTTSFGVESPLPLSCVPAVSVKSRRRPAHGADANDLVVGSTKIFPSPMRPFLAAFSIVRHVGDLLVRTMISSFTLAGIDDVLGHGRAPCAPFGVRSLHLAHGEPWTPIADRLSFPRRLEGLMIARLFHDVSPVPSVPRATPVRHTLVACKGCLPSSYTSARAVERCEKRDARRTRRATRIRNRSCETYASRCARNVRPRTRRPRDA